MQAVGKVLGAPEAPDPHATADAQTQQNLDALYTTAAINQMGINMPGYNISYTGEIGDPDRTMNLTLSPEKQMLADILYGGVRDIGQQMQFMPDFSGDYSADAQRVEDATFDAIMSRLRPEQERLSDQTYTRLNVSGNPMGSEIYGTEMDRLQRLQTDENLQATLAAIQAGRGEHSRLFDIGITKNQLPYKNLAQLLALDPTNISQPDMPSYQMMPADLAGMVANNYAQETKQYNAMLGGLSSMGAAAMLKPSDRRLKHSIVLRGTLPSGINVYEFSFLGSDERHIGVIAQEVDEVMPEAVFTMADGYLGVNYGMLQ